MTSLRGRLVWQAVTVVSTGVLLVLLRAMEPVFWFQDDKRNQYLPVARDLGRRLRDGEFPTIDPSLGTSGNYAIDLQYGLYEPTHWLVAIGLSYVDNLAVAGFLWGALYLLIFAWGTTALAFRLGASGPWAAVAGVGAATSGYVFYWLAPNWIPGMASMAWLPWLWWAWSAPLRARRCVGIAVFAYLAVAGGWPATWIMLAALATGFTIESLVRRDRSSPAVGWAAPLGLRALSTVAGMVPAVLTVLPLVHAMDHTVRNGTVSNRNFLVPNLADMLAFAAPSLHGDLMTFGNQTTVTIPIYFAAWFAVPVLWLVPWRASLVRAPGLVTAAIGMVAMAMATQAPSALGPLRDPVRALAGAQFFLVVGVVVLACTAPLVYSRLRGGGMAVSLLLMAMLTWFRDPPGVSGVLAVVAVAAAVAVVVGLLARSRLTVAGGVTLVATLLLAVLAFGLNEVDPDNANVPVRLYPGALTFGRSDQPALAIYSKAAPDEHDEWYADGVGRGFERMTAGTRFAPGYSSIRQSYYSQQFCVLVAQGETCPEVVRSLFATEDRTDRPWIELLGYRTVVVTGRQERRDFATLSHGSWRRVDQGAAFTEYRRRGPAAVTGRVTDVLGEADLQVVSQSPESQSYDVSSADGATLVFRDLYWPGYHATLDGSPLAVDSLDDILVSVTLPPGAHGRLTLSYSPLSTAELVGLPAAGGALMGAAMLGVVWWRRRSEPGRSAGVDGDGGEREPDEREPLQHPV